MSTESTPSLRRASFEDADRLLAWRNDPTARAQSLSTEEIDGATHRTWLARRLADEGTRLFIAEADGVASGMVRVDTTGPGLGEISVAVAAEARGAGLGRLLVEQGARRAAAELALDSIDAVIKPGNAASLATFRGAGFGDEREELRDGEVVVVMTWRPPADA